jgi:hypothetical protein
MAIHTDRHRCLYSNPMQHVKLFEEFQELTFYTDGKRHLVCRPYTKENLHLMAQTLGIPKHFYEDHGHPHYDIPAKRKAEIETQCIMVSPKEILRIIKGL